MESNHLILLSLIAFLPALGALVIAFFPKDKPDAIKLASLATTLAVFLVTVWMAIPGGKPSQFSLDPTAVSEMQDVFNVDWIPSFNIAYYMGVDGISFPLVVLTSFSSLLAMGASWPISKHVKAYCIL